jgi:hypothetical protein
VLCIAIDAADNAEIAAREFGNERSFARDLLREPLPVGIKLVALCRTERRDSLDLPPNIIQFELTLFSRKETKAFLRNIYPDASENDIDEFHRLTSQKSSSSGYRLSTGRQTMVGEWKKQAMEGLTAVSADRSGVRADGQVVRGRS